MATPWKTLTLPKIPSPLTVSVDALKTVATAATTALKLVKASVEALSALAIPSLSASQIAIQGAVTVIEAAVASLTEDTGLYVLLVPPRSKVIIPEEVRAALSSTFLSAPTPAGLNIQAQFAGETQTQQEARILNSLFTATGGNAGFVRTVTESFDDLGDDNRPVLASTDAVAGAYLVAGATNIAAVLPFTNGMSSLLSSGQPATLDPPALPTAQDLQVKLVSGPNIRLRWALQKRLVALPVLDTIGEIVEQAIIRSTSATMLSATTPQDLFGTTTLTAGQATGDGKTVVLAVEEYTGLAPENTYLDMSALTPGTKYYYAVSYHVKLGTSPELLSGGGTDIGFPRLSNVVKVYVPRSLHGTPRSIAGAPPDWVRTPRVVDLFPAIGGLLTKLSDLAGQFGATTSGYSDLLKANIQALEQQIQGYTDLAAKLTEASAAISAFSSINLGSASIRLFAGTGGTDFVKKDIVKAFGDTSDANRPPFDADEFVTGVVILATTPSAIALFNLLLGSVASSVSIVADALAKIDVELATIEATVFNDDMSVHAATAVAATTPAGVPQIGTGSYCYQSYTPSVTFDDNLNPL